MLKPEDRKKYNEAKNMQGRNRPVFKVIADYPDNKDFPVGKIIQFHEWSGSAGYWEHTVKDCQGERSWLSDWFEKYPHLFERISF